MMHRHRLFTYLSAAAVAFLVTACSQDLAGADIDGSLQSSAVQTAVIDFEGLAEGAIVGSLSSGNGISGDSFAGSVVVAGDNGVDLENAAMVFDATCGGASATCSGDDEDLYQPDLGNVLIVSEDLDGSDPDDSDNPAAEITFDLTGFGPGSFTIASVTILDIDDNESADSKISFYASEGGALIQEFDIPDIGDRLKQEFAIGAVGVGFVVVHFNGSGAVDNIELSVPDEPRDPQGCTPGYWRQPHHYDSWVGYDPSDLYADVFGVDVAGTLGETIRARGGGANALLRASTAALLNAAHPDLAYAYTAAEVIAFVQEAFASGDFSIAGPLDDANNAGCPLN